MDANIEHFSDTSDDDLDVGSSQHNRGILRERIQRLLNDNTLVEAPQVQFGITRDLLRTLDKADWKSLEPYGMLCLKTYQHVHVDFKFLKAAMAFWDPLEHVFFFNGLEICLVYEEFSAIAGRNPTKTEAVVFTNQTVVYPRMRSIIFDLSLNKLYELVMPDKRLIPLQLLGTYSKKRLGSPPWACILSCYLFLKFFTTSHDELGDYRIL